SGMLKISTEAILMPFANSGQKCRNLLRGSIELTINLERRRAYTRYNPERWVARRRQVRQIGAR
ncbi:MAG TPA: hypothetical protein VGL71_04360, partial [Urbifossiella sp.]